MGHRDRARRRARVWLLVAATSITTAGACTAPAPESPLRDQVQTAVDEHMASYLVPGMSVTVLRGDDRADVVAGVSDTETKAPVEPATPFRIASVTKMFLSAAAMSLADTGALRLDDPISRYALDLPEQLAFVERLSLRDVLSQTTGLTQTYVEDSDRGKPVSQEQLLARIPRERACRPLACWSYADGNYVIAGLAVEQAAGAPLPAVLDQQVLRPLGLTETRMIDAAAEPDALPPQYALVSGPGGEPDMPKRLFRQDFPRSLTMVSSARDLASFARALFTGELLSPESLREMLDTSRSEDLPCHDACRFPYGLGVFHYDVAGANLVGHDGGSGAVVVYDKETATTIAVVTNGGEQNMGAILEALVDAIDRP